METKIIRVEPIDSNFEKWGAPVSTCTRAGNMVFVSGMPPFDPETGEILVHAPFERQVELILEQVKKALEAAGSDLDHVLKCNVMCISADRFKAFNEVYKRFFPKNPPARIFFCVPEWTGPFDVEVDCIAVTKDGRRWPPGSAASAERRRATAKSSVPRVYQICDGRRSAAQVPVVIEGSVSQRCH